MIGTLGRRGGLAPVALVLLALVLLAGCKKQNAFIAPPPPQVGIARPLQQEVTPYLELTGNAQAVNQVDLVARVQGFLQAINYQDGASAKQGDTLFVIEPAPYEARLQQAQAQLAGLQAQLIQSQAEYNRQASLGRTDFSSKSTVDQARATQDTNQANVANQQANVTLAAINLGYTRVTAPFDGQVTNHQVSIGSLVGVTGPTTLATIVQLDPIRVICSVSEQDVLRIKATLPKRTITPSEVANVPIEVGRMNEADYPTAESRLCGTRARPFDRHADRPRGPGQCGPCLAAGDVRADADTAGAAEGAGAAGSGPRFGSRPGGTLFAAGRQGRCRPATAGADGPGGRRPARDHLRPHGGGPRGRQWSAEGNSRRESGAN